MKTFSLTPTRWIAILAVLFAGFGSASAAMVPGTLQSEARNAVWLEVTEAGSVETQTFRRHEIVNRIEGRVAGVIWSLDDIVAGDHVVLEWTVHPRQEMRRIREDQRSRWAGPGVQTQPRLPVAAGERGEDETVLIYAYFDVEGKPESVMPSDPDASHYHMSNFEKFQGSPSAFEDSFQPPSSASSEVLATMPQPRSLTWPVYFAFQSVELEMFDFEPADDVQPEIRVLNAGETLLFFGYYRFEKSAYFFDPESKGFYRLRNVPRQDHYPPGIVLWPEWEHRIPFSTSNPAEWFKVALSIDRSPTEMDFAVFRLQSLADAGFTGVQSYWEKFTALDLARNSENTRVVAELIKAGAR